ncbi:MAG: Dna2/Cas4 domain-containing protein [Oligoflexia bacterium]|nr:Dna2/Cas4 domain-containing protein [Oligoflexia bacterium]
MREQIRQYVYDLLVDIAAADTNLVLLLIISVAALIVLDAVTSFAKTKRTEAGIDVKSGAVSIDGSKTLPVRKYVSEMQGLAGVPDALICENGYIIPVERKPLARKIRDRYVAQLLVYMRLVEEFEGKRPPYGYLILGPSCRRFKIENTPDRQAWLQKMIDEMHEILAGAPAKAAPHPTKCRKCSVHDACRFRADTATLVQIGNADKSSL